MDTAISRYAKAKGISETEAVKQFKELNTRFNNLYGTGGLGLGTFDINNDNQRPAHDAMGAAFKKDPALFEAFNSWRTVNGGGSVKDALESANNSLGFKDTMRGINDSIMGSETQKEAYSDLFGAYGFTENADGSFSEPFYKEQGKKAADEAIQAAAPPTDAEVKAAAEAAAAAPKTLDQPEGGAAPAQPTGPTGVGQRIKNINDAAQSLPANVPLGTGGATKANRAQMNMQAEANRQMGDFIKQQKKQSDQNNFLRDRYDATGGRRAGAWDRLSDQQKDEAVANYRNRSSFNDSNPFHQQQYNDLMASGYTPPKADIQSQYEAASMNPPSVARADGTATTEEFGSMSPAQQRAFIQNYRYKPQGQTPKTVQEGLMGNAMISSNPLDNIGTTTLTPFMTEEEQDDIVTQSLGLPKTENLSPFIPGSFPANQPVTAAEKQGVLPPALRQQPEPEAPTSIQRDPSQGLLNLSNPSQVLPPQDFANEIVKSLPNPIPQKANEFDVSKLPVLEEVQTTENEIPDFSNVPSTAPAPQAGLTSPQGMPPREEGFEEFLKPDPPQAKPKSQSPVYGKKSDGTYGVTGYRDNNEMKKSMGGMRVKPFTAAMDRDRREKDLTDRAQKGLVSNPFNSDYNRALGQKNEDAYAERRKRQKALFNPYFS